MIKLLLHIYKTHRRHKLRLLIKLLIKNKRLKLSYRNFLINVGTHSFVESLIIFDEYNEVLILELIESYIKSGYGFLDIGANIGIHTLTAASTNESAEIYSFEPDPNNYYSFVRNIILNQFSNVRPFMVGLGKTDESLFLNINGDWNKGKHSLVKTFGDNDKIATPVLALDSFKNTIVADNLFIKIDVEGFEKEVVEGAFHILNDKQNIVLSIELIEGNHLENNCQEILDILKERGFKEIFMIENKVLKPVQGFVKSSDYIVIKGNEASNRFKAFLTKYHK